MMKKLFAFVVVLHIAMVKADENDSSVTHADEKSSYIVDEPVPYIDSYGNYYANWTPDLYQKYGLPQDYYHSSLHDHKKGVRRQGAYEVMTNMLGEEAAVTLGLLGSLVGLVSLVGIFVNANSIDDLSRDQDSICSATQGIGNTALTLTALTDITTTNPTNTEIVTRLNLIENAINNWSTPDCN